MASQLRSRSSTSLCFLRKSRSTCPAGQIWSSCDFPCLSWHFSSTSDHCVFVAQCLILLWSSACGSSVQNNHGWALTSRDRPIRRFEKRRQILWREIVFWKSLFVFWMRLCEVTICDQFFLSFYVTMQMETTVQRKFHIARSHNIHGSWKFCFSATFPNYVWQKSCTSSQSPQKRTACLELNIDLPSKPKTAMFVWEKRPGLAHAELVWADLETITATWTLIFLQESIHIFKMATKRVRMTLCDESLLCFICCGQFWKFHSWVESLQQSGSPSDWRPSGNVCCQQLCVPSIQFHLSMTWGAKLQKIELAPEFCVMQGTANDLTKPPSTFFWSEKYPSKYKQVHAQRGSPEWR